MYKTTRRRLARQAQVSMWGGALRSTSVQALRVAEALEPGNDVALRTAPDHRAEPCVPVGASTLGLLNARITVKVIRHGQRHQPVRAGGRHDPSRQHWAGGPAPEIPTYSGCDVMARRRRRDADADRRTPRTKASRLDRSRPVESAWGIGGRSWSGVAPITARLRRPCGGTPERRSRGALGGSCRTSEHFGMRGWRQQCPGAPRAVRQRGSATVVIPLWPARSQVGRPGLRRSSRRSTPGVGGTRCPDCHLDAAVPTAAI